VIVLSDGWSMPPENADALPLTTDDAVESYQADPIVIPYRNILDPAVGRLTHLEVGRVDAEALSWVGVAEAGVVRSGTMRLRVEVGEASAVTLGWDVEVDDG